jgi:hypothetical protein
VIFSHEDLTLNGTGTLTISASYAHGIVGKDDVRITGGTYVIDAVGSGIQGKDCIKICDGTFTLSVGSDGLHSSNSDDETLGYIGIFGGTFTIDAADDGMHAGSALLISAGVIDITNSYEGLEGKTVSITGGDISVVASDDGLNAATGSNLSDDQGFINPTQPGTQMQSGGQGDGAANDREQGGQATAASSECLIEISGGNLYVKAGGDCLDSNGSIAISGGDIIAESTSSGMDAVVDCDEEATITGGTFGSVGPVGMVLGFSSGSTQASIMLNGQSSTAGKSLLVYDSSGKEVYSFEPTIASNSILISSPALEAGQTYTIESGGQTLGSVVAATTTTVSGNTGGGGGGGGNAMPNGKGGGF